MANRIVLNPISYHGHGAIENIVPELTARGFKKAFLTSDADLVKFGVTAKVTALLDAAGFAYTVYSDIKPNPTIENVKDGVAAEPEADAILYGFERQAGTYPRPGTIGKLEDHPITTAPVISFEAYGFVKCGTRRCGE